MTSVKSVGQEDSVVPNICPRCGREERPLGYIDCDCMYDEEEDNEPPEED